MPGPGWERPGSRTWTAWSSQLQYIATLQLALQRSGDNKALKHGWLMAVGMQGSSVSGDTVVQLQQEPVRSVWLFCCSLWGFWNIKPSPPKDPPFCWGRKGVWKKKKKGCIYLAGKVHVSNIVESWKVKLRCDADCDAPFSDGPIEPIPQYPRMPREPRRSPGPRLRNMIRCATSKSSSWDRRRHVRSRGWKEVPWSQCYCWCLPRIPGGW